MNDSDNQKPLSETTVTGWWGRANGRTPAWCVQNGWREAIWKYSKRRGWHEASATLRPVVGITFDGEGILGEPRKVR